LNIMQMEYLFLYRFYEVHKDTINRYIDLQDCVPDFHNNFLKLMQSSRQTNKLAKAVSLLFSCIYLIVYAHIFMFSDA